MKYNIDTWVCRKCSKLYRCSVVEAVAQNKLCKDCFTRQEVKKI
jgi:hypothetical protein